MANIRLQGQASAQRLLRKLWPIRSWRRESCREGGAGAALPQVMRTRLAASAQVASVALPTITRSAMARKRKFDAALGSVSAKQLTAVSLVCGLVVWTLASTALRSKPFGPQIRTPPHALPTTVTPSEKSHYGGTWRKKISRSFGSSSLALPTASLEVRLVKVFLKRGR